MTVPPAIPTITTDPSAAWDVSMARVRVVFGAGTLLELGALVKDLGGKRALIVTDAGLRRAGHVERAEDSLRRRGLEVRIFDAVRPNPTTRVVEEGAEFAHKNGVNLIIGLGGGSSMDCAKGINFLVTNGGRMEDYQGTGKAKKPMLPSVGVPTTAGTGSEAQSYALIAREKTHIKMACGDEKARFRAVILDPELAVSAPQNIAAMNGMDAVAHAVETWVTTRRNPLSQLFSREAWRLIDASYEESLQAPGDLAARGRMLWGAHLAGAAIEASMLGAAHACANPLTARHGVEHGQAVALTVPWVIRFNAGTELYNGLDRDRDAGMLAARVEELRMAGGLAGRLRDVGVTREELPELARDAAAQWTAGFNPRAVGEKECMEIYESAF